MAAATVLFNDAPTPETIAVIAAAHRRFGTTGLLPTLISDSPAKMQAAADAVEAAAATMPGVLGIHFEGPFLAAERAGVHDPAMFRQPGPDDLALLTARRRGVTLTTLAPEQVPGDFIESLALAGVRVALGHSMATYARDPHRDGGRTDAALPICSTRCGRCWRANPARSRRRSRIRAPSLG